MIEAKNGERMVSVMEIERFAIHDGPGIRTVIFMQGCPLTCTWCSNPESQKIHAHLLYYKNRCVGCGKCSQTCSRGVITIKDGSPVFDRSRCVACQACASVCPASAITFAGKRMSVSEIMSVVKRDNAYYKQSGGGITFSGGEAFVQFDALMELLADSRKEGIHTAIETCGQVDLSKIEKASPLVDLFLFDIKHADKEMLKKYTGAGLNTILTNLSYLSEKYPEKIVVRIPVIPGFNYTTEDIQGIFTLAVERNLTNVHLLPYHMLGKDKYEQLGLTYSYPYDKMLTKEELFPLKKIGEDMGLQVQIGG